MPLVNVMINQRAYTIACDEGEEEHLRKLAAHVDSKVKELLGTVGQAGEQRLLLMAALLVADEYLETVALLEKRSREADETTVTRDELKAQLAEQERQAAGALQSASKRVEELAARLGGA